MSWDSKLAELDSSDEKINFMKDVLLEKDKKIESLIRAVADLKLRVSEVEKKQRPTFVNRLTSQPQKVKVNTTPSMIKTPTNFRSPSGVFSSPVFSPTLPSRKTEIEGSNLDTSGLIKKLYVVSKKKIHVTLPPDFTDDNHWANPPDCKASLDWIFGYCGRATHNNLHYLNENEIVYHVAGQCIVYNISTKLQRYFSHNDDITCICVHPDKNITASGQVDPKGKTKALICIWNTETMEEIARIDHHDGSVQAMSFSPDGQMLLSVGGGNDHPLAIWDWKKSCTKPIFEYNVSKETIYGVAWEPDSPKKIFITMGYKSLKFWEFKPELNAWKAKVGTSSEITKSPQKAYFSGFFPENGTALLGTFTGDIYQFVDKKIKNVYKAHSKEIGMICPLPDGSFMTTGYDSMIKIWNPEVSEKEVFDLKEINPLFTNAQISSASVLNNSILIGTTNGIIATFNIETKEIDILMQGHSDEMWGLAVNPSQTLVASGGNDKRLIVWDYMTRLAVPGKEINLGKSIISLAWSPDGTTITFGLVDGKVGLINYESFKDPLVKSLAKEQVAVLTWSTDSKYLAAGSWDQYGYILDPSTLAIQKKFKGHSSSITHMQFSEDNKYVMTNSRDYEILFWNAETGGRVSSTLAASLKWPKWQCVLGWPVIGVFPPDSDGTDVNNIDSAANKYLATGDDFGNVKIFNYPILDKKVHQNCITLTGHSAHVTNVRYSFDNKYLISLGGNDLALMVWKIE